MRSTGIRIVVSWDAPTGTVTDYDLEYRFYALDGSSTDYGSWVNQVHPGTSRSQTVRFQNGYSYQFRVRGGNGTGEGAWSDAFPIDGVSDSSAVMTAPGKVPSGAAVPSSGMISISWAAPTSGGDVTEYEIQYRFDNSGGTSYGGWLDISHSSTSRLKTRAFFNGYRHQFRVRGVNSAGNGAWSDAFPSAGVIPRDTSAAPGKVTDVRVSTGNGILSVSWDAPSGTVTDYDLFYRVDSSGGTSYGGWIDLSHSGTTRAWSIRNSSINDRRYQFRVRANNGAQLGAWSDATPSGGAVPGVVRTIPGKVSGGAVAASDGSMTITWDAPTSGSPVDRYVIAYRVDTGGGTSYGGWTGITTTNTSRTLTRTVFNARRYQYRVHGVNSAGNGAWSDAFPSGGIVSVASAPSVPTNGSAVAGDGTVAISWTFTARVSSFNVQWREVTVGMAGIVGLTSFSSTGITENISARTATHPGAVNGKRYQYRVRATFQGTNGSYTQPFPTSGVVPVAPVVVVVVVPGAPGKPSGVTGNGSITLSWDPPTTGGDVSSYRLEYQLTSPDSPWVLVSSTIGAGTTRYLHSGRTNGTAYRYRILGYNDGGTGAWSPTSDSLTPNGTPGKPGSLAFSRNYSSATNLSTLTGTLYVNSKPDSGGSAITSYYFTAQYYDPSGGFYRTSVLNETVQESSGHITWVYMVSGRVTYRIRVRAINKNGYGPWSDWSSSV